MDTFKDVTPEMLSGNGRKIAETIGMEAALKLFERFGGVPIYMPKLSVINARVRADEIREEYKNGVGKLELAKRYKISERMVYLIVSNSHGIRKAIGDK